MIQRIQSVYLLSTFALMALLFLSPFISFVTADSNVVFDATGFHENGALILSTVPLLVLIISAASIALVSIFLFKNRLLQMRLCVFNLFILLGIYGLGCFYIFSNVNFDMEHAADYGLSLVYPFIAIVFTYLALRAIGKDEALIRSVDRIR